MNEWGGFTSEGGESGVELAVPENFPVHLSPLSLLSQIVPEPTDTADLRITSFFFFFVEHCFHILLMRYPRNLTVYII